MPGSYTYDYSVTEKYRYVCLYEFRHNIGVEDHLPITDKLYRKLLVAEFLKSTRHLYTPSSFRCTSSTNRHAGSVTVRKEARFPNTSGAE